MGLWTEAQRFPAARFGKKIILQWHNTQFRNLHLKSQTKWGKRQSKWITWSCGAITWLKEHVRMNVWNKYVAALWSVKWTSAESFSAVSVARCGGDSTFMTVCTPESWFGNSDLWVHKQLGCSFKKKKKDFIYSDELLFNHFCGVKAGGKIHLHPEMVESRSAFNIPQMKNVSKTWKGF